MKTLETCKRKERLLFLALERVRKLMLEFDLPIQDLPKDKEIRRKNIEMLHLRIFHRTQEVQVEIYALHFPVIQ